MAPTARNACVPVVVRRGGVLKMPGMDAGTSNRDAEPCRLGVPDSSGLIGGIVAALALVMASFDPVWIAFVGSLSSAAKVVVFRI